MPPDLAIPTERGDVHTLYDSPPGDTDAAVLMVGGADGGFDGPVGQYRDLAADLLAQGIGVMRLDFRIHRFPNDVDEGVHDVLAGIEALTRRGVERVGLLGHSFGGAAVVEAGAASPAVACVATLATQTAGVRHADAIAPRPLLVVHGLDDRRLSPECSRLVVQWAREPKRLVLLEGATHSLRQRRDELRALLAGWFAEHLGPRHVEAAR